LSEALLPPYPMSLAINIFFFFVLDLLCVFSSTLHVYLGSAPCASNEFPLVIPPPKKKVI